MSMNSETINSESDVTDLIHLTATTTNMNIHSNIKEKLNYFIKKEKFQILYFMEHRVLEKITL